MKIPKPWPPALILLTALLVACGEEAGTDRRIPAGSESSEAAPTTVPGRAIPSELTAEDLAAESDTASVESLPESTPIQASSEKIAAESMAAILSDLTKRQSPTQEPIVGDTGDADAVTELDWEALIPPEWQPEKIMEEYNADELEDDDPRAQELLEKLRALWKKAPVVTDLDGKPVKLPGFIVPLDTNATRVGEFLLVPYYGACIHVPPPPANQTVHVVTAEGLEYGGGLFDAVWVSGTLKVESSSSELADAGYRIDATRVEPYE